MLFVLFLCLTPLSVYSEENRIVNGTSVLDKEFSFAVSIRTRAGTHNCGGTILDEETILTAAHCVCGYQDPLPTIQYGVNNISIDGPNIIQMKEIFCHEEYIVYNNTHAHNDIAVIKLKSPIIFDDNAKPVKLTRNITDGSNTKAILLGWGLNATNGIVQTILQKVEIDIIPQHWCTVLYPNKVIESNLCAGLVDGGKGQCSGDSGGPLILDGYQVGIVSWSVKPCASPNHPGVFTRVSSFIDWISRFVKV